MDVELLTINEARYDAVLSERLPLENSLSILKLIIFIKIFDFVLIWPREKPIEQIDHN